VKFEICLSGCMTDSETRQAKVLAKFSIFPRFLSIPVLGIASTASWRRTLLKMLQALIAQTQSGDRLPTIPTSSMMQQVHRSCIPVIRASGAARTTSSSASKLQLISGRAGVNCYSRAYWDRAAFGREDY